MSKSALFAVGAPHTWPSLLAALSWLTEMLNYEEKAAAARADTFDAGALPGGSGHRACDYQEQGSGHRLIDGSALPELRARFGLAETSEGVALPGRTELSLFSRSNFRA